jgi:RNA polymerase sigma-70 factor (ECF subfamily)
MDSTPVSLLRRLARQADEGDWDRFVKLYTPLIYYWGRRAGLQVADAADLVQDVLTTLIRKLPEFHYDSGRSFRSWLRTVTLNHWRDRHKRRATQPLGDGEAGLSGVATADGVELFTEEEYRQHVVGQALRLMREEFQETTWKACWEHAVAGRPAAEVAAELGLTVGAVYAAKFRAMARLRKELEGLVE